MAVQGVCGQPDNDKDKSLGLEILGPGASEAPLRRTRLWIRLIEEKAHGVL